MPVAKSGFSPAQAVHVMQADMPASEATLQKAVQTTEQQAEQEAISTTCSVQPAPCVTRAGCMYTVSQYIVQPAQRQRPAVHDAAQI